MRRCCFLIIIVIGERHRVGVRRPTWFRSSGRVREKSGRGSRPRPDRNAPYSRSSLPPLLPVVPVPGNNLQSARPARPRTSTSRPPPPPAPQRSRQGRPRARRSFRFHARGSCIISRVHAPGRRPPTRVRVRPVPRPARQRPPSSPRSCSRTIRPDDPRGRGATRRATGG